MRIRANSISRRRLLTTGMAAGVFTAAGGLACPFVSRANDRPMLSHGLQSGDVSANSGIVWARADRPARMLVEWATTDSFKDVHATPYVDALPETDLTAKLRLTGLPTGQEIFYRIRFQDLASPTLVGEPSAGHFLTAPADGRSIRFMWSGDTAGQGWGIDESRGGMRTYATMLKGRPDFFIHNGDNVYADGPIASEQKMPDGGIWKNLTTEEKSKPAETLNEFRGAYKYNLLDKNILAFNAEVPIYSQWDDHEVFNNWYPNEQMTREELKKKGYKDKNSLILAARAARAFHEYMPLVAPASEPGRVYRKMSYGPLLDIFMLDMRSYRGPNAEDMDQQYGPNSYFLGPVQLAWLKRELLNSRATWKVIAADMPISLVVVYDTVKNWGIEAIAQGDNGAPRGRELEIADLLSFMKRAGIRNTVWLTADVHYTAAHYYDPNKAAFQDFDPFWEFVSGPLHAGTFGPNQLDGTFGPQLVYAKAPAAGQVNLPPSAGLQFFGHVAIDGATRQMTVTLKDVADTALWSKMLDPAA